MNYTYRPHREDYANFAIQVTDTIGRTLSITEDDLPFNIFIDTIHPSIKLDGNVSYSISQGTINPFIPNVTITDGDPNYSGNYTLVPNNSTLHYWLCVYYCMILLTLSPRFPAVSASAVYV